MRFKFLYKISDLYVCWCPFFYSNYCFWRVKECSSSIYTVPQYFFQPCKVFVLKEPLFFEFLCFFVLFKASFGCSLMYKYKMLIVFFCPVHVRVPWAARGGRAGCQAQLHLHRPLQVDRAHPPPPLDNNTKSDGQQQHHHPIDSSQHVLPQS